MCPAEPTFISILTPTRDAEQRPAPAAVLHDLALDQLAERLESQAPGSGSVIVGPLLDLAGIRYRQAVFKALDHDDLRQAVDEFITAMGRVRDRDGASASSSTRAAAHLWRHLAIVTYTHAVEALGEVLTTVVGALASPGAGWEGLHHHVARLRASAVFRRVRDDADELGERLGSIRTNVLIDGPEVSVAPTDEEPSLCDAVATAFSRFRDGETTDHRTRFPAPSTDHVQLWILDGVVQVHPDLFTDLERLVGACTDFYDPVLLRFADEVRFYLAYADYLSALGRNGLPVCYPEVDGAVKGIHAEDTWDLVLAGRLAQNGQSVVLNDLELDGDERIAVISGPNQGGKTTLARVFGQLHHLASLGCPVPGRSVRLMQCDRILTAFERVEDLETLDGRLGAEVQRLHDLLAAATGRSVVIVNEAFSSTSLDDARILTRDVLERISALDALAVCVTFIDELSRLNAKTVSLVSEVDPSDPSARTFRVVRRRADGRAHARALARKHGLLEEQIHARLAPTATGGPTR